MSGCAGRCRKHIVGNLQFIQRQRHVLPRDPLRHPGDGEHEFPGLIRTFAGDGHERDLLVFWQDADEPDAGSVCRPAPGSTAFCPPVMGLIIAGEVVKDICNGPI